jgi:LysM repeat protein
LTYTVQHDDALERIANVYNTTTAELAAGNCLRDPNVIIVGQVLKVPGTTQPDQNVIACVPWELLTPANGTLTIAGTGNLTFNWRGPRAPRNLIRVIKPDGSLWERVVELRQNETVDVAKEFPAGGTYSWYVYPLDQNFVQIACHEAGPFTFTKAESPTATPTLSAQTGGARATPTP